MSTGRQSATKWYLAFLYLNFLISVIKGVVLVPIYLKFIDPRLYGAWLAGGDFIGALGLAELGIANVLQQRVAETYGREDSGRLFAIVSTGLWFYVVVGPLPIIISAALAQVIPDFVQVAGVAAQHLKKAIIVASCATSLMIFYYLGGAILRGLQRQVFVNILGASCAVIGIGATVGLLYHQYSLLAIPLGNVLCFLVASLGGFVYILFVLKRKFAFGGWGFDLTVARDLIKSSMIFWLGTAFYVAGSKVQNIYIAHVFDPRLCAVYSFTSTAPAMLMLAVVSVSQAVLPGLAHYVGEKGRYSSLKIVRELMKFSLMASVFVMSGALILNRQVIGIWVGPEYYGGGVLNAIFCINGIVMTIFLCVQNISTSLGAFAITSKSYALMALLQFPLMIGLGYFLGLPGVALSGVVAAACAFGLIHVTFLVKTFQIPIRRIFKEVPLISLLALIPPCIAIALRTIFSPQTFGWCILEGAAFCVLVVTTYYLMDSDFRRVLSLVLPTSAFRVEQI